MKEQTIVKVEKGSDEVVQIQPVSYEIQVDAGYYDFAYKQAMGMRYRSRKAAQEALWEAQKNEMTRLLNAVEYKQEDDGRWRACIKDTEYIPQSNNKRGSNMYLHYDTDEQHFGADSGQFLYGYGADFPTKKEAREAVIDSLEWELENAEYVRVVAVPAT